MAQVAGNDVAEFVDEILMAVHAASVPETIDRETLAMLNTRLGHVLEQAIAQRLVRVANIVRQLRRLMTALELEEMNERHAGTVRRGLDVLSLLAQDAERQKNGHPSAALDDAVDCFVDQVERTLRGERGARIMKFPQFRTRAAVSSVRGSWSTPTGTI